MQLPTFHFFSVATTVSVPDSGGAYMGGIGRGSSGRNRVGSPFGYGSTGVGGQRQVAGVNVQAQLHAIASDLRPAAFKTGMLATAELASAVAAEIQLHELARRRLPQIPIDAPLHNPKQGLIRSLMGRDASLEPAVGAGCGLLDRLARGRIGRALVKGHDHIGPQCVLNFDGALWR